MPYQILLVDDEKEFREEFCDFLEDYNVLQAENGEQALEILKKPNEIDLVILDVNLPGQSGTEVLRQMKGLVPDLSIIILTGHSSKDVAVEALKNRADDFIEKPLDIRKSKEIIDRLLATKRGMEKKDIDGVEGKIERVKYFVRKNSHKMVRLEDAASLVCLSPKYLSRVFEEKTGQGFNDFKLEVKMEKAKELLERTNQTINEISFQIGYQNVESFIRLFKKMNCNTPSEFRKSIQNSPKKVGVASRKPTRLKQPAVVR
jgi:two-component system, response regulator YesN